MTESIHREMTLAAPPARVWRALTDTTEISEWMYPNDFKPEVGHRFTLQVPSRPDFDGIVRGEVLECVPDQSLSFTWAGGDVVGTTVHHSLEPVAEGTLLRFDHAGFDVDAAWGEQALKGAEYGWNMMLRRLSELVTTKP
jgi:uncharacterized protein YndB with AHSA1/START domain